MTIYTITFGLTKGTESIVSYDPIITEVKIQVDTATEWQAIIEGYELIKSESMITHKIDVKWMTIVGGDDEI